LAVTGSGEATVSEATSNVEMAHKIHEHGHEHRPGDSDRRTEWLEIVEAIVLAIVAITTAWSGYQAALWDARSSESYVLASAANVQAQEKQTLAGQNRLYDAQSFEAWLSATVAQKPKLADFYVRRFRPEYKVAFDAWMKLDPFKNYATVPPGPIFMPQYKSELEAQATELQKKAKEKFEEGVKDREIGDTYVRLTVFLATVLLLTALSQRFRMKGPRIALLVLAGVMLAVCTYWLLSFPRILT
jgi:hypothetical protein